MPREEVAITGQKLKAIREQLGLTQVQFAALLDIHAVTLSRWETETPNPTANQLELIRLFAQAADPERAGFEAGRILARKGPVPAMFFLLKWVLEEEGRKKRKG